MYQSYSLQEGSIIDNSFILKQNNEGYAKTEILHKFLITDNIFVISNLVSFLTPTCYHRGHSVKALLEQNLCRGPPPSCSLTDPPRPDVS